MSRAETTLGRGPSARHRHARFAGSTPAVGRLILVMCSDMGRVDLVLRAAARRLETSHDITLAEPVATRSLPAGGGMIVTRNGFARLERDGEIVLGWTENGRSYGYGAIVLERLARGETVACALPAGLQLETAAQSLWCDVKVVSLEPGTQTLRSSLSPRMALARTASTSMARSHLSRLLTDRTHDRIADHGCISSAVKALTASIEAMLPARALPALAGLDAAAPLVAAAKPSAAHVLSPRKLGSRKPRQQPPAKRADKPQVRATLTS